MYIYIYIYIYICVCIYLDLLLDDASISKAQVGHVTVKFVLFLLHYFITSGPGRRGTQVVL